jgi:hypothetical protein
MNIKIRVKNSNNFLNNQNYIINSSKNTIISNFIWFKTLSLLNSFIENNISLVFILFLLLLLLITWYFSVFFAILVVILIKWWIDIKKYKFKLKDSILNTKSYLFSENINDYKITISAIFIIPLIPFLFGYLWFIIFDFIGAILFSLWGFIFISTKFFKENWKKILRLRLINIILFPIFLIYYLIIKVIYKKNFLVYLKKPNFKIFNWFRKINYYEAENEDFLVIKK